MGPTDLDAATARSASDEECLAGGLDSFEVIDLQDALDLAQVDGAHPVSGSSGWSEISVTNQAIGVTMGGGRTVEQARVVL